MARRHITASTGDVSGAQPPPGAPDSVQLAALGLAPGRELVAYVMVGSHCGYCQLDDTKAAIASLRAHLKTDHAKEFTTVTVIGVVVDRALRSGLEYLNSIGMDAFDEISVGSGWQNTHMTRFVRRDKVTEAGTPQVVVLARTMTAHLRPVLTVDYSADSILTIVPGHKALLDWVAGGTPLQMPSGPPTPTVDKPSVSPRPGKPSAQR